MIEISPKVATESNSFIITQYGNEYKVKRIKGTENFNIYNKNSKLVSTFEKERLLSISSLRFFSDKKTNIVNY